jgi:N-acetylglucosamine-6-phosphate deacetylase
LKISAARTFINGAITQATIEIAGPRIVDVTLDIESGADLRISESEGVLVPGLIDLQINGGFGIDFQTAEPSDIEKFRQEVLRTGVTGFLPTLITASHENIMSQIEKIDLSLKAGQSDVLGIHLEGPYISQEARGTHELSQIREINLSEISEIMKTQKLKMITLAPELSQAKQAIEQLVENEVIVSLGHSQASSAQTLAAVEQGARMITHIFNAQSGVHHRESGMASQALINPNLYLGIIADLYHLTSETIKLIFQTAASRAVLVTDAISAMGMPDGTYQLGNQTVAVKAGQPPMRADGVLAGSAVRLDECIKNVIDCAVAPELAIAAATSIPAQVLGLADRGEIKRGLRADLALLSENGRTSKVWHLGEEVALD